MNSDETTTLPTFLLVSGGHDTIWQGILEQVVRPLGHLEIVSADCAVNRVMARAYKAILVDASATDDFSLLTSRIRGQQPDARVLVITASPTWKRARDAFQAGATDYIRKTLSKDDLFAALQAALAKPLVPWP